jgi:hypothetical protein
MAIALSAAQIHPCGEQVHGQPRHQNQQRRIRRRRRKLTFEVCAHTCVARCSARLG